MASSDLTVLSIVAESTLGTTPGAPTRKQLRYTGESLSYAIENVTSNELRPDRSDADLIQSAARASGAINFELSYESFTDLLEGAFCSSFSANVLKPGTTRKSYTIQKHFSDITPQQYHDYQGCLVDGMSLSFETGRIVTGSFSILSFGPTVAEAQSGTVSAPPSTTPMNAVTNLQDITIGGAPYSGCITRLSLELRNSVRAINCLGNLRPTDMRLGALMVTGSIEMLFREGTNYDRFLDGTEFDFGFVLTDADGNSYTFSVPRAKYETGEVVAGGRNSDVMFSGRWRALYDAGAATVMSITRSGV